jgi:benzoate membrane transport protein
MIARTGDVATGQEPRMTTASEPAGRDGSRSVLPAIGVALPILIFGIAMISIVLAVAETFDLSAAQTSTLYVVCYGLSSVLSLGITYAFRQPLFIIWSSSGLIFMASLAETYPYSDMLGATFAAGAVVCGIGLLGWSARLARLVPAAVVLGVLAGLLLPFVVRIFTDMQDEPWVVGSTVAAWLMGRRLLPWRIPPLLPALLAGMAVAAATGDLHRLSVDWVLPELTLTRPTFSPKAILTIAPVLVVLMAPLANLSAVVILRNLRYTPPARAIDVATGACTMLSAFLVPVPVNMGNFVTALTAGPEAGPHHLRHWSVYVTSGGMLLLAMTASVAVGIPAAVPLALLFAVTGLALVPVLGYALAELTRGPLRLGPLLAFAAASSDLSLGGLGPAFWAMGIGIAVTLLLETREWQAARAAPDAVK